MMKRLEDILALVLAKVMIGLRFIGRKTGLAWVLERYSQAKTKTRKAIAGFFFISPWLVGLVFFGLRPLWVSLRMSVADMARYIVDPQNQSVSFVIEGFSLSQYRRLIQNEPGHVEIILDVLLDVAMIVPLVMLFALVLALMLNQPIKGKGVFRVIFFIPVILLSGNMLAYFNQYDLLSVPAAAGGAITGAIDNYLPAQFSSIIGGAFDRIVLILWLSGVQILIFLAGLQKMNRSIYEAAAIDGASMWESFWKITLPSLYPLMILNIVYTTVVYANLSNNALIGLINQTLTDIRFGRAYASALAWILFMIEILVIAAYVLIIKLSQRRYR